MNNRELFVAWTAAVYFGGFVVILLRYLVFGPLVQWLGWWSGQP
jgi:hypothetical protein